MVRYSVNFDCCSHCCQFSWLGIQSTLAAAVTAWCSSSPGGYSRCWAFTQLFRYSPNRHVCSHCKVFTQLLSIHPTLVAAVSDRHPPNSVSSRPLAGGEWDDHTAGCVGWRRTWRWTVQGPHLFNVSMRVDTQYIIVHFCLRKRALCCCLSVVVLCFCTVWCTCCTVWCTCCCAAWCTCVTARSTNRYRSREVVCTGVICVVAQPDAPVWRQGAQTGTGAGRWCVQAGRWCVQVWFVLLRSLMHLCDGKEHQQVQEQGGGVYRQGGGVYRCDLCCCAAWCTCVTARSTNRYRSREVVCTGVICVVAQPDAPVWRQGAPTGTGAGRWCVQVWFVLLRSLMHLCDGKEHRQLQEQGKAFVEVVWKLLERLLIYRLIIQDEIKEHRMSCIVNLLVGWAYCVCV